MNKEYRQYAEKARVLCCEFDKESSDLDYQQLIAALADLFEECADDRMGDHNCSENVIYP